jgi:hypothetical protein
MNEIRVAANWVEVSDGRGMGWPGRLLAVPVGHRYGRDRA